MSKQAMLYDKLLARLTAGEYRFGEPISVKEISEETGASRQPIMAALNALSADGFVRIVPQVGCEVANPSAREISDFFKMFSRMEGLLAELAAERRTDAELSSLKDLNGSIRKDLVTTKGSGYKRINRSFHATFHEMASSPLLDKRQGRIFAMSDFFIVQTVGFRPRVEQAAEEHQAIIDAIESRDGQAARAAAEHHINQVAELVLASLGNL